MVDDTWEQIHAEDLAQHHVGKLVRVTWTHGHTVTGRMATLQFHHRTRRYADGSSELGQPGCRIVLEIGSEDLDLEIPLRTELEIKN